MADTPFHIQENVISKEIKITVMTYVYNISFISSIDGSKEIRETVPLHPTSYPIYHMNCGGLVQWLKLPAWKVADSNPILAFKFQRNKMFLPRSLVKIKYCGEPLWPRGSVLSLRPQGIKVRFMCLEGSVISSISPSAVGSLSPV